MFSTQNKQPSSTLNFAAFRILNMKTLRERLEWALGHAKINQAELARQARITRGAVSLWFNGTTKTLEGENLTRAATALDVNPHWLATGEGQRDIKRFEAPEAQDAKAGYHAPIHEHATLISVWEQLPQDVQNNLRALISTLAKKRR